ncbi:hypothetical protein GCM10009591_25100 [Brachybacterium tyrofermentans]
MGLLEGRLGSERSVAPSAGGADAATLLPMARGAQKCVAEQTFASRAGLRREAAAPGDEAIRRSGDEVIDLVDRGARTFLDAHGEHGLESLA